MRLLAAISLSLALSLGAEARPVRTWTPEELGAAAEVVANGRVESIKLTDERSEMRLSETAIVPLRIAEAKVTTLSSSQGKVGPEFRFRFPQFDPDRGIQPFFNGPISINLEPGKRYRFYLKRQKGVFVGALNGEYDDAFAVQPLASKESDQSSPLTKNEAITLATAAFRKVRPRARIHTTSTDFNPFGNGRWSVQFYTDPPLSYPDFSSDAEIVIDGSRRILPVSWIGTEKPRAGNELTEADRGRPVRLLVKGDFSKNKLRPFGGGLTTLVGTIDQIGKRSLSGKFTSTAFHSKEPQLLSLPASRLLSVQRLAEGE